MNSKINPAFLLFTVVAIVLGFILLGKTGPIKEDSNFTGISENNVAGEVVESSETDQATEEKPIILAKNYSTFNRKNYEKALSDKKIMLLFFYANWSPTFASQEQEILTAFNNSTKDGIVGFRVNFTDNETSEDEEILAKTFDIEDPHVLIILDGNGSIVQKFRSFATSQQLSQVLGSLD